MFYSLNAYSIKLNPTKCVFGVPSGQLLGYLVSSRGIEPNPEKIQAILTMKEPTNLRGEQQLAGRPAALSRFIARLGEKALPFYKLLKKTDRFEWTPEAKQAFADLKRTLSSKKSPSNTQRKRAIVPIPRRNQPGDRKSVV